MILETVLGGLGGYAARLAPEVLKFFDRKNERGHELAMLDKSYQLDKLHAEQGLALAKAQAEQARETGDTDKLLAAYASMAVKTGIGWIDALSQIIRPVLTIYWCIGLYTWALWAQFDILTRGGVTATAAVLQLWGPEEKTIVAGMIAFWFADRTLKTRGLGT
jgi:hypothetical protein